MLQTFIDDSIAATGDRRLFLAAYVQTAESWIEFSDAWGSVLCEHPKIEYFKMSEAHRRGGQFRNFSESARTKKVFALAKVIKQFSPWGIHTSISTVEFQTMVRPHAPFPMATPYFYVFFAVLFGIAHIHNRLNIHSPCKFIFDEQLGLPAKVIPTFQGMFKRAPDDWNNLIDGTPTFEDDKQVLPLQAADMLAWHIRREHEGNYPSDYDGIIDLITVEGVHSYTELTSKTLEHIGKNFEKIPDIEKIDKKAWREMMEIIAMGKSNQ